MITPITPIRIPEAEKQIFVALAEKRCMNLSQFILEKLCIKSLENEELSPLDKEVLEARLSELQIKKYVYLRKRNFSEGWQIPRIIQEIHKSLRKNLPRDNIDSNLDYSLSMISLGKNPKEKLNRLYPAMKSFEKEFKWDYGKRRIEEEMQKLECEAP